MLPPESQQVQEKLNALGIDAKVKIMTETTHTAQDAANALGVELGQIAKTLVFKIEDLPCLVVTSGDQRVSTEKLESVTGRKIKKAKPDEVKRFTGFDVGGVCPVLPDGFGAKIYLDESLKRYESLWVAAGTSNAVFNCTLIDLSRFGEFQCLKV